MIKSSKISLITDSTEFMLVWELNNFHKCKFIIIITTTTATETFVRLNISAIN